MSIKTILSLDLLANTVCTKLVYYEQVDDIQSAIQREKRLKKWNRRWKLELIEKENPEWRDLYDELL
jgi:putative endonuclease